MKKNHLEKMVLDAIGKAGLSQINERADKERMKNDPRFKRPMENSTEFGGASTVASAIKDGVNQSGLKFNFRGGIGRLGSKTGKAIKSGPGKRGERSFEPARVVNYLNGFEFSSQAEFSNVFPLAKTLQISADRKEVTLAVEAFNPRESLNAVKGATHFRLLLHAALLTVYQWDANVNLYVSQKPEEDRKYAGTFSSYLPIADPISARLELIATFDAAQVISPETAVMACIGIEFYQEINGEMYPFSSDSCLRIEQIFV